MTEQEQIEEMRKEIENGFRKADCRQPYTNEPYPYFETQKTAIAKALYEAGYRKVDDFEAEDERLREVIRQLNTDYNRSLERLKSDCREIAELKEKLNARLTCDFIRTAQTHAVQEFADRIKVLIFQKDNPYDVPFEEFVSANVLCGYIDELLKEYEDD